MKYLFFPLESFLKLQQTKNSSQSNIAYIDPIHMITNLCFRTRIKKHAGKMNFSASATRSKLISLATWIIDLAWWLFSSSHKWFWSQMHRNKLLRANKYANHFTLIYPSYNSAPNHVRDIWAKSLRKQITLCYLSDTYSTGKL